VERRSVDGDTAAQQRIVLAVLLVEAGRRVTVDRLVDEVWGERPPRTAVSTLRGYAMHLRRALGGGPDGPLLTRAGGYELHIADGDVDSQVFDTRVDTGRRYLAGGQFDDGIAQLTEALALWQGPPLSDVPPSSTVCAEATRLEQRRLAALEDQLGAQLDLGRHADVVDVLHGLVSQHPLRERLWLHLMLALYRSGRGAEALAAYQAARRALVDEYGIEPGPELRELQQTVLAGDQPPTAIRAAPTSAWAGGPIPAQLPADVPGFTGRAAALRRLDALRPEGAFGISTISGTAGVGKTALAVHWAHRVRDRYPDGQLYVNLRGYAPGAPVGADEVLARFLHALGVPADDVPAEPDEAAALYRSLLAERRVLVLLDNAGHPDQVRPLLPGSTGCHVLVTSRDHLAGLVARDGAVGLDLEVLEPGEAVAVLAHLLGADRVAAEPEATAELARLCGHLPLALRIAAANLAAHPGTPIAAAAAELAHGDRLAALDVEGDAEAGVRAAFDLSYAALSSAARRLFRLLGLLPGSDLGVPVAAALADVPVATASRLLDRLAGTHLLERTAPGRYALHDLLRLYAAERTAAEDGDDERGAALDRHGTYYLARADAAVRLLYPQIARLPMTLTPPEAAFAEPPAALEWLDTERANLVATVRHAGDRGAYPLASLLADALRGYLHLRTEMVDWQLVATTGLAAGRATGDPLATGAAQLSLGTLHWAQARYGAAAHHFAEALELIRGTAWLQGLSAALGNLGTVYRAIGEPQRSAELFLEALEIDKQAGWQAGMPTKYNNLGVSYAELGRLDEAEELFVKAQELHRASGSDAGYAMSMGPIGEVRYCRGRYAEAIEALQEAYAFQRKVGANPGLSSVLVVLSQVHRDVGAYAEAAQYARSALDISRQCRDRRGEGFAHLAMGGIHQHLREYREAAAAYGESLRIALETGGTSNETVALAGLAMTYLATGEPHEAVERAHEAYAIARKAGYRILEDHALNAVAAAHLAVGNAPEAQRYAQDAIRRSEESGHRLGQAYAHVIAERAVESTGDELGAEDHARRAHALFTAIGVPEATHTRLALGRR